MECVATYYVYISFWCVVITSFIFNIFTTIEFSFGFFLACVDWKVITIYISAFLFNVLLLKMLIVYILVTFAESCKDWLHIWISKVLCMPKKHARTLKHDIYNYTLTRIAIHDTYYVYTVCWMGRPFVCNNL